MCGINACTSIKVYIKIYKLLSSESKAEPRSTSSLNK